MKKSTLALALGTAALLVGCGGGGGSSSGTAGGSSSSTGGSSSSTGGSSSSTAGGNGSPVASLTLNNVDDVKGYTLKTNKSTIDAGSFNAHQTITLSIGCDGSFDYTITSSNEGGGYSEETTDHATGTEVELTTSIDPYMLSWYGIWDGGGVMDAGETAGDNLSLDNTNQIIAGQTCWMNFMDSTLNGEDCPNNLYIKTITQDEVCQ